MGLPSKQSRWEDRPWYPSILACFPFPSWKKHHPHEPSGPCPWKADTRVAERKRAGSPCGRGVLRKQRASLSGTWRACHSGWSRSACRNPQPESVGGRAMLLGLSAFSRETSSRRFEGWALTVDVSRLRYRKSASREFPRWLGLSAFTAEGQRSIPGQETKTPQTRKFKI